jgi:hypothetical protein
MRDQEFHAYAQAGVPCPHSIVLHMDQDALNSPCWQFATNAGLPETMPTQDPKTTQPQNAHKNLLRHPRILPPLTITYAPILPHTTTYPPIYIPLHDSKQASHPNLDPPTLNPTPPPPPTHTHTHTTACTRGHAQINTPFNTTLSPRRKPSKISC